MNGVESFDKKDFEEFHVEDIYGQDELVGEHDVEQEGRHKYEDLTRGLDLQHVVHLNGWWY